APDLVGSAAGAGAGLQHGADGGGDLVPQGLAGAGEGRPGVQVPADGHTAGLHRGPDGRGAGGQPGPGGRAAQLCRAYRPCRGAAAAPDAGQGTAGRVRLVIVALALLGYAVLLLTAGAAALARARWPESS